MARLAFLGIAFALIAVQLAGCARTRPPAPVEVHGQARYDRKPGSATSNRAQANNPAMMTQPGVAVVQPGDTLFGIARRNKIPIRAVIDANGLEPPYILRPGQRLTLPQVRLHVVQAGDTVYGISRRHGVDMSALVRANGIEPPYTIPIGQTLILPGQIATPVDIARAPAPVRPSPAPDAAEAPQPAPAGELRNRRVDSAPLPPPERSPSLATSSENVRTNSSPTAAPAAPPAPPAPQQAHGAASTRTPGVEAPDPDRTPPAPDALADANGGAAAVPARSSGAFLWPLRGRVVSDFGPKGGGLHNDGINIAASRGAPIRAAENGVVVYAGNELRGFGNLLLLRHADGWMTAYAHADEILVSRGARVRRGQVIGHVGMTGNVTSPQLHFEIRRGSRAVNPLEHLESQSASSG